MKINVEIDDDVYNFLEGKGINVGTLFYVFSLRCSHLVKESGCPFKVNKLTTYSQIARQITKTAKELEKQEAKINGNSKMASEKLKESRIKREGDGNFI